MGSVTCILSISSSDDEAEDDVSLVKASSIPCTIPSQKRGFLRMLSNQDDDVVIIDKLPCIEGRGTKEKRSALVQLDIPPLQKEASDDDCCILEVDPWKNLTVMNIHGNATDDLIVTGENGPVACRDFPHARYLCVKFPFSTTSHDKFCEQCHCYVCDKLAPCLFWCEGTENNDGHCHASDKDEKWKSLRKVFMSSQTLLRQITKSLQPLPTSSPQLLAVLDHQHQNARSSRKLPSRSRSGIVTHAAAASFSVGPCSQNSTFVSHVCSGRGLNLIPVTRSVETIDARNVTNSHVSPMGSSVSQLPHLPLNQGQINVSSGAIESSLSAGITPVSNGIWALNQNYTYSSWQNSSSATSTGIISQNCNSASPVSSVDALCTTHSSMLGNNQLRLDHQSFGFSRPTQPSIISHLSLDLVGSQRNIGSLPFVNPCGQLGGIEPLTVWDYLYGMHRERDEAPLLQLNRAEGQQLVVEESARLLNQSMPRNSQVNVQHQDDILVFGDGLHGNNQPKEQGNSSTATGKYLSYAGMTVVESLVRQAVPYESRKHDPEVLASEVAVTSDADQQNEVSASCSSAIEIQNFQLNPVSKMQPPDQYSSLQSQHNSGVTEAHIRTDSSVTDAFSDFNAWEDADFSVYDF